MVAYVRGGTELRVHRRRVEAGSLARQRADRRSARVRASDRVVAGRQLDRVLHRRHARLHQRRRRSRPAAATSQPGQLPRERQRRRRVVGPDGTFLFFDTSQRTENGELARVDLILRTPRFREDQFRDLFNEENAPRTPSQPNPPTSPPSSTAATDAERAAIVGGEAGSQAATQSRSRSSSTTSASGPPSCRPASTSARRSSARTARRSS